MGRVLMGWGDPRCPPAGIVRLGQGGCQRLCGLLLDSKRPTPRLQSLLLSVRPHLAAFSHRFRQRPVPAWVDRQHLASPRGSVTWVAVQDGQSEVDGGRGHKKRRSR
ncbi:hypothetical protein LCGC14_2460880 [marine sediment metagenome]|uniref:Uncharacterized protein n=1 Tax=marine sediment metagenome TaxID=412755 RepID=A0A0F9E756_9ZZZZ